jgi:hypothetical protein
MVNQMDETKKFERNEDSLQSDKRCLFIGTNLSVEVDPRSPDILVIKTFTQSIPIDRAELVKIFSWYHNKRE